MTPELDDLAASERMVLEGRFAGEGLKQIAARRGLHWGTVAGYQARAVRKLLGPRCRARGRRRMQLALRAWERLVADEAVRAATD